MESWQQDWFRMFETIAQEINQLFEDIGRDLSEAADSLLSFSEEVAEEVEHSLEEIDQLMAPKLAQWDEELMQWVDPILQAVWGIEATIDRAVEPVTHTVEPWLNQHPVCVGCRHYHGQEYGGNLLVCAMHPYGMEDGSDSCPDKEAVTWSFPRSNDRTPWDDDF
jgi:hypothetical protein